MSKVFLSYSHDSPAHRDKVLALSQRLRQDGIETLLDQYVNGSPPEGWPHWMLNRLDEADYVLVICTETYYRRFRGREQAGKGKGATWEGALITQEIYDSNTRTGKFIPVFLGAPEEQHVPEPLRAQTYYALTSQGDYDRLYDHLLAQSGVEPAAVGTLKRKPRRRGVALTFDDRAETPEFITPPPGSQKSRGESKWTKPPPEPPDSLVEILVGRWQVQIQPPFATGVMGQLRLDLFPNGLFRGQLLTPMGFTAVEGQWQADPFHRQIGLQGGQSNGFQMIPYAVLMQVTAFDARQVHGVTSGGEQVHWQRLNPPRTPPPLTPF